MEAKRNPWTENLQSEIKAIPKISLMEMKSNIYLFEISDVGRKKLTEKLKTHLSFLWDLCHYSTLQRKAFNHISQNLYKDNSEKNYLAFCDIEVAYLKQYYAKNKELFQLLEAYKRQYIKINSAPENEKNIISKRLADIENSLKRMDVQYKLENGRDFYTWGKTITETIDELSSKEVGDE